MTIVLKKNKPVKGREIAIRVGVCLPFEKEHLESKDSKDISHGVF